MAHRICNRPVADPVVAAANLGGRPLHLHLLFVGHREEVHRLLARRRDQILRDAMPGDYEKSDLGASRVDLTRHFALLGPAATAERRHVDCRDRILRRHGASFHRMLRNCARPQSLLMLLAIV
jgi:hypothetical protein